jgi:hypothetical protein
MAMSHTSESVPPSLGAMSRDSFVFESKTATFETLASCWPLRCSTLEKRPPSQMLVPTCSMARTRPSTMGVSSAASQRVALGLPRSLRASLELSKLAVDRSFASPSTLPW